ncbi:3-oxoacyl-ACP reductase [Rhizorhabdus wittichii DC-6]|nr:3-oxoacyl-ACP reductase [Rhizorhabdus wittichii DC-6]
MRKCRPARATGCGVIRESGNNGKAGQVVTKANFSPRLSLEGKTVVITGAAQGVGRAIAEMALDLGANIAAVDLNVAPLESLRDSVGADRLLVAAGDVTDPMLARKVVAGAVAQFGKVHGLVNNAGITRTAMIEKMSLEAWQQVLDVHLTGAFHMLQAVGSHLLDHARNGSFEGGSIINISSDAGRRGTIGQVNYGAAKAGVLGLTMSAAREWARYGVRVNSVGFGVIETPMTETLRSEKFRDTYLAQIPLGRFGTTEEVASPVCFLLSEAASYITGQHIWVNGGYTIGS